VVLTDTQNGRPVNGPQVGTGWPHAQSDSICIADDGPERLAHGILRWPWPGPEATQDERIPGGIWCIRPHTEHRDRTTTVAITRAAQNGTYVGCRVASIEMSPATLEGSDALDPEPSTGGFDHRGDVLLVRGDHDLVTPSDRTFSNGHVHDVVVSGPAD
jgi:hypothetical protein